METKLTSEALEIISNIQNILEDVAKSRKEFDITEFNRLTTIELILKEKFL